MFSNTSDMTSALENQIQEKARPYLDLVDKLKVLGIDRYFPIPQIAVMGDQSSGKSSVLEAISGVPFPRGIGLVTRLATCIKMKKVPVGTPWKGDISVCSYCVALHDLRLCIFS